MIYLRIPLYFQLPVRYLYSSPFLSILMQAVNVNILWMQKSHRIEATFDLAHTVGIL